MVKDIGQYPWSSYHYHAKARADNLIQPHELYLSIGSNTEERCANYQNIFEQLMPEKTIKMIRDLTNKSFVLGDDKFINQIETQLKRRIKPKPRGGDRKSEGLSGKVKSSDADPFDLTPLILTPLIF